MSAGRRGAAPELAAALATGALGLLVLALYAVALAGDPHPALLDRQGLDLAEDLRTRAAVALVKVVTALGALPTVAAAVLATAIALAARRRGYELGALLVGSLLIFASVHLLKAAIDRPRPPAPLVHTRGQSFPSGHAAYSTAWVAAAVAALRALPRIGGRRWLIAGSISVCVAVGLSRIYLRAHYWSDVAAGWGLGFGVFGACAAVALTVACMRHNGRAAGSDADRPETAARR